jgi:hypothetical protein
MVFTGFDGAGGGPYISAFVRSSDGSIERKNYIVKEGSGKAEPFVGDLRIGPEVTRSSDGSRIVLTEPLPIKFNGNQDVSSEGKTAVWISFGPAPESKKLLVSTDATDPSLSPDGGAMAYMHAGCLLVRKLVDLPLEAYMKGLAAESQIDAMDLAKEAAAKVSAAEATVNFRLPNAAEWDEYCERAHVRASVRARFVYLGGLAKPLPEAEIGSVQGIGGRAVVHADLTVTWVADSQHEECDWMPQDAPKTRLGTAVASVLRLRSEP